MPTKVQKLNIRLNNSWRYAKGSFAGTMNELESSKIAWQGGIMVKRFWHERWGWRAGLTVADKGRMKNQIVKIAFEEPDIVYKFEQLGKFSAYPHYFLDLSLCINYRFSFKTIGANLYAGMLQGYVLDRTHNGPLKNFDNTGALIKGNCLPMIMGLQSGASFDLTLSEHWAFELGFDWQSALFTNMVYEVDLYKNWLTTMDYKEYPYNYGSRLSVFYMLTDKKAK